MQSPIAKLFFILMPWNILNPRWFKRISISMECCILSLLLEFLGMQNSFLYSIGPEYLNPIWPQDAILRVIL